MSTPKSTTLIATLILLLLSNNHHCHLCSGSPIKTVVVLVMENRSFDHMLGWMKKLNPEINGVTGSESNPISTTDPNSPRIFFSNHSHFVDPDPGHSFQAIREQIFGSNNTSKVSAPMDGFAQQANSMSPNMTQSVMNGFEPDMVSKQAFNLQWHYLFIHLFLGTFLCFFYSVYCSGRLPTALL